MGERWVLRIRRRRLADAARSVVGTSPAASQTLPWEFLEPWDGAGPSWTRSTWRTCGLCGRRVICLVDCRDGVVGWVCTTCDR